ncbi:MAG: hypothetical protein ABL958_07690 [Bdellovibrionia bacterium]
MKSFIVTAVVTMFATVANACPQGEGATYVDLKVGKTTIGRLTNNVDYQNAEKNSITVSLNNGYKIMALGASAIQYGEAGAPEIKILRKTGNGNEYAITGRNLQLGERIQFTVQATANDQRALIQVVNGRFGSRPRGGGGCGGPLTQPSTGGSEANGR